MDDKLIVTHRAALTKKYGTNGMAKIRGALAALVTADKKRGLRTRIIYLDDAAAMKKLRAKPVENEADYRAAKRAIDKVFTLLTPDYLMILGAPDVVPHQDLTNPVFSADGDDDRWAWSDLPYACDSSYSQDPAQFVGPTRVVGRLPDIVGANNPSHLLTLLRTAANWKRRPSEDYSRYFALSAEIWKGSTRLSLDNIFGNNDRLLLAPPKGPKHPSMELGALMHFINCHGGPSAPEFYGQKGEKYPVSLTTATTAGVISSGTVASVECCYGGELYDSVTLGIDKPICQSYLEQGAYGYLGSTTIAYGPADENGAADFICQYFLLNVLGGASIGRAALMARQQFAANAAQLDPIDLKTLAQFCVYGDPSVHPVVASLAAAVPNGAAPEVTARFRRSERRAKLKETGEFLQKTKPTASRKQSRPKISSQEKTSLSNIAFKSGLRTDQKFTAFNVKGVKPPRRSALKLATGPSRYFVTVGWRRKKASDFTGPMDHRVAVVAKEVGGRIIDYCIYHER